LSGDAFVPPGTGDEFVPLGTGDEFVPLGTGADEWRMVMLDVIYLAIGFGFLAVAVLYVVACDRL